jgi:hypothetical protein
MFSNATKTFAVQAERNWQGIERWRILDGRSGLHRIAPSIIRISKQQKGQSSEDENPSNSLIGCIEK